MSVIKAAAILTRAFRIWAKSRTRLQSLVNLNSASDASELTQCKRKRKCRNEDKYDGSLEVHNSSRFARSLPKSLKRLDTEKTVEILLGGKTYLASEGISSETDGQMANNIAR